MAFRKDRIVGQARERPDLDPLETSLTRQERKLLIKLCERLLLDFEANPEMNGSFE